MAATPSLLDDTPSLVTGTEWDTSGRITDAEWGHFTIGGRFRSPSSFQSPSSSSSPQPAQPPRPASPPLDFSDPTSLVTFIVGPDGGAQNFLIHKSIVCQVSPPLKAAFNSQFIEGQTQTYRLDDVKPKVFQLLMQWFYSRKITFKMHNDYGGLGTHSDNHVSPDICHSDRETTIDLWVLAGKLLLPQAQNLAMDHLLHVLATCSRALDGINLLASHVYEHTAVNSPLRRLFVKILTWSPDSHFFGLNYSAHQELYPREFLFDVILGYRETASQRFLSRNLAIAFQESYHVPVATL